MKPEHLSKSIDDVLTTWEARVELGENPTAEELCGECPELLDEARRQIRALQSFASRFGIQVEDESQEVAAIRPMQTRLPVRSIRIESEYFLEALHAVGGLGSVYLAFDAKLNRRVALKFPRGYQHSDVFRKRFEREARITSRLDHPGIVPVHTILSTADAQLCYAMRFIKGDTLQEAINRFHKDQFAGRFRGSEFRNLLRRFQAVCEIVAYAHGQGVIHRDIKPSNIMLGAFGETLLVDWGLAKTLDPSDAPISVENSLEIPSSSVSPTETQQGQCIGTPAFASPEQLSGQLEKINECSDVFSLGATLYSLLTGEHLLQFCELPEYMKRIQEDRTQNARDRCRAVPVPLNAICAKSLAVKPAARYQSPLDLAGDIDRYLADEPISILCESWWLRTSRWLRKHSVLAASTLVLIFVGLTAAIVSSLVLSDKNQQLSQAVAELQANNINLAWLSSNSLKMQIARNSYQEKAASAMVTSAQVLKSLNVLSDHASVIFPDRREVYAEADGPFLRKLRERFLGFAAMHGSATEALYIQTMGNLQAGGLSLCLHELADAEAQLSKAKKNLIVLQAVSRVAMFDQSLARCCALLGQCHLESGDRGQALQDFNEALARFDKIIAGKFEDAPLDILLHRADVLTAFTGLQAHSVATVSDAERLRTSVTTLEERFAQHDDKVDTGIVLIRALKTEALLRASLADPEKSRILLKRACETCEELIRIDPQQKCVQSLQSDCLHELSKQSGTSPQSGPSETVSEPAITSETANRPAMERSEREASAGTADDAARIMSHLRHQRQLLMREYAQLRKLHIRDNRIDDAVLAWEEEQRLKNYFDERVAPSARTTEPEEGLSPHHWIYDAADIIYVEVQGNTSGTVWGSGPYTDDSDICAAAVHSGHLQTGELKFVGIRRLPSQKYFEGSTRNGVTSGDYGEFCGGYEILGTGMRHSDYQSFDPEPGMDSVNVVIVGSTTGTVEGSDVYTSSSHVGTAAVHCGLIKPDEVALIRVELLPGRDTYDSSTRNGVTTSAYGTWPGSMRLHRLH